MTLTTTHYRYKTYFKIKIKSYLILPGFWLLFKKSTNPPCGFFCLINFFKFNLMSLWFLPPACLSVIFTDF